MQIQIHTDNHIQGDARLVEWATEVVSGSLHDFTDRVTRVEVHLSDDNGALKAVGDDKRCVLEARVSSRPPMSVTHTAPTVDQALSGAVDKLEHSLRKLFDRLSTAKGRPSFSGE